MRIGITIQLPDSITSLFLNGVKQNALFFANLLTNLGYDIYLISKEKNGFNFQNHKIILLTEIVDFDLDIVFQFAMQIPNEILVSLKDKGVKLVSYNCGNDYVLDLENALFGKYNKMTFRQLNWSNSTQYSQLFEHPGIFDQIWSIPQMSNQNLHYWKTLYSSDVIEVPFIWSPDLIDLYQQQGNKLGLKSFDYVSRETKKVAIFEPNINSFKWSLPALLVCENSYRLEKNIDHVFVTNIDGNERFNIDFFSELVKPLILKKDNKISVESRYNTLYFMSHHADIAVSFQHENPLNYLYLDLAWFGWPVVHNAHLCKDIGYYYEGFNYEEGGKVLDSVITGHHLVHEEYKVDMRKKISRYLPTNSEVQSKYKELIERLFI
jgi:hypothetical protein